MNERHDPLDGRIAQGWGGVQPDGVHANIVIAARGSATAAAMVTCFACPSPGFTPIVACVAPEPWTADHLSYETINPPTIVLNKSAPVDATAENLVFGAAHLGAGQGVLDSVAAGLLEADQEHVVFASLWINPEARDETAVRINTRAAVGDAVREAVEGRPVAARQRLVDARDSLRHPLYAGA